MNDNMTYFLSLAAAGSRQGCSSGELVANKLARAVLDAGTALDAKAQDGFVEFAKLAYEEPHTANKMLQEAK